ncbi:MAG: hypothetical protein SFW36_11125, partial [Leptolyngbyaceae cyanobacterium bins.59]|nr:hypothetical protein [Leptolyngbyaceae cyanobacterium bins.59]
EVASGSIVLRDPVTQAPVYDPQGNPVFLSPLKHEETGEWLRASDGLPILPVPLRDPQTQAFVFNDQGTLVTCPLLRNESGQIIEFQSIPQFCPPAYQIVDGLLQLQKDAEGQYLFSEVEFAPTGELLQTPEGMPVFSVINASKQVA